MTTGVRSVFADVCPFLPPFQRPVKGPGKFIVSVRDLDGYPLDGSFELRLGDNGGYVDKEFRQYCELRAEMRFDVTNSTYRLRAMHIRPRTGPESRRFAVRFHAEHQCSAAAAAVIDVDTGNFMHIVRDESERPYLTLRNPTATALAWHGEALFDDGRAHSFAIPINAKVSAGKTARFALPWPLPAKGLWRVTCELTAADGSHARHETRFGAVVRHEATPFMAKPNYRIGLNYYLPPFSERSRELTVAALVASGAKMLRTNVAGLSQVYPKSPDDPRWAASDHWLAMLRSAGIAVNANTFRVPLWARVARLAKYVGNRADYCETQPGVLERFYREIAARYGTKIDYYEIGNEWDLIPKEVFGVDAAIRMQREAWRGIKAGCPNACVCLNGWACAVSSEFPKGRAPQPGFVEDFMAKATGTYDVHAVHLHGNFRNYVPRIANMFLLRKELGIESVPWYSNETALSCHGGIEDEVALAVWEKPLYAWAHGSTDFIWYNLRATGWAEGDSEQEYGLLTADWHPRTGFCALAALTELVHGLTADKILFEQSDDNHPAGRFAFRVRGTHAGQPRTVIFAWDMLPGKVEPIIVKTTNKVKTSVIDHFGNAKPLTANANGEVTFTPTPVPSALLLEGTDNVKVIASVQRDLTEKPRSGPLIVTLDTIDHVVEHYAADPTPASLARLWKGKDDLSARLRITRANHQVTLTAEVTDDVDADGDTVVLELRDINGKIRRFDAKRLGRSGNVTRYQAQAAARDKAFVETRVFVYESDGAGVDGYLHLDWTRL